MFFGATNPAGGQLNTRLSAIAAWRERGGRSQRAQKPAAKGPAANRRAAKTGGAADTKKLHLMKRCQRAAMMES